MILAREKKRLTDAVLDLWPAAVRIFGTQVTEAMRKAFFLSITVHASCPGLYLFEFLFLTLAHPAFGDIFLYYCQYCLYEYSLGMLMC